MKYSILADTGPLYAGVDPDDNYHAQARQELERLSSDGYVIFVAYPTLLEAYTLILRRLGIHPAHIWLAEVVSGVTLVNPTPDDYRRAILRILAYVDQPLTLCDTVVAVISERLELAIWTYDYYFDLMRVSVWR